MKDKEKRRVLNALYNYYTHKKCAKYVAEGGGVIVYYGTGGSEYMTDKDLARAIEIAERTQAYFELQDEEVKTAFIKRFFFNREGWTKIMHELHISHGTTQNWRNEAIAVASKIARKNGFI